MNTRKLKEALYELQVQRSSNETAIKSLDKIIATLNGGSDSPSKPSQEQMPSFLDAAVTALQERGKPMHIKDLVYEINKIRGSESTRNSVQATFSRHVKVKGSESRIVKSGPAIFALPSWPSETKELWREIVNGDSS